jgi:predicted dehydrogenase/threonine dehydrogenase-like Zn-dependent dehydrogenase
MMNQVFLKNGLPVVCQVPSPLLDEHSVLVEVHYSFISSGTERATIAQASKPLITQLASNINAYTIKIKECLKNHGFATTLALIKEKQHQTLPLGYSCSGKIIGVGKAVKNLYIGDFVACAGSEFAFHANIVKVPYQLVCKLATNNHLKHASITTIGSIALQGIRRANIQLGEKICILGLGLLGQLSTQLAKLSGAQIFGIDIQQSRLDLAQHYGAFRTFYNDENVVREILFATDHHGVDTTIITASSASGELLQQAMEITRRKGKVIIVGDIKLDFDRNPFYAKEIDLLISCSYGPGRYDTSYEQEGIDYPFAYVRWTEQRNLALFSSLIEQGQIDITQLISNEYAIENAADAFINLQKNSSLGTIISYTPSNEPPKNNAIVSQQNFVALPFIKPQKKIRVGVVGIGGFAKTKLLPTLQAINNVTIDALADINVAQLISLSKVYQATIVSNSYTQLASNRDLDAVVIATPHSIHTQQALHCMTYGKAVFLEKPAAINFEQLHTLAMFMLANPKSLLCVDFNRAHAPYIQKIKQALLNRRNPVIIQYSVNAGFLPLSHWTQSSAQGGRLIGEACHIIDLFCFLTDAHPRSLQISVLQTNNPSVSGTDNISMQLSMSDGSICSLLYTAQGNFKASKEYCSIFFDGKTIIMDDYKKLEGYGISKSFNASCSIGDKGHANLLKQFFKELSNDNPTMPIPFTRIYITTLISIVAHELALAGGGSYFFTDNDFIFDGTAFQFRASPNATL